jgi:hypothetical protein
MLRTILIYSLSFLFISEVAAFHKDDIPYYENKIYNKDIKTVLLHPQNTPFDAPIYKMDQPREKLILKFDDLDGNIKNYRYIIVQCDYEWKPTLLNTFEYIDGFSQADISDYQLSTNTIQRYVHYQLEIPNNDMKITKSGNYAVVVFDEFGNDVLFTWRFMVLEFPKVEVNGNIFLPNNPIQQNRFQEIRFSISHKGLDLFSPFEEIKTVITQNERPDVAIYNLRPLSIGNNVLHYNHNMKSFFQSGREFRWFDMRSLRFRGVGLAQIYDTDSLKTVYIQADRPRSNITYRNEEDLNGRFIIQNLDFFREHTESDYAWVVFNFCSDGVFKDNQLYVHGAFNNWQLSEENRLHFDTNTSCYSTALLLKQGFYNYQYAMTTKENKFPDVGLTEGNFLEAENEYTIYIYHRPFGQLYDQLIGVHLMNSFFNRF